MTFVTKSREAPAFVVDSKGKKQMKLVLLRERKETAASRLACVQRELGCKSETSVSLVVLMQRLRERRGVGNDVDKESEAV